jgi:hypothetical protein
MTPEVPGCMFEVSLVTPGNLDQSLEFGQELCIADAHQEPIIRRGGILRRAPRVGT